MIASMGLLGAGALSRVGTGSALSRLVNRLGQSQAQSPQDPAIAVNQNFELPTAAPVELPPVTLPTTYAQPAIINPGATNAPPTGLIGAEQAMNEGYGGAESLLLGGSNIGADANKFQAAVSGALGPQEQEAAYQRLGNSPATRYAMDQMQRSVERSAASRGGLLGGNTLRALQENAAGIASQDYQNQVNNASAAADRGSSFTGLLANLRSNLGMEKAVGRTNAGMAIAQNAQTTSANLSNLLNQQGVQSSELMSGYVNSIGNMLHDFGMQDSVDANSLAQILANISGGQASNLQQGYNAIGNAKAAGILGTNSAVQNAFGQAIQLGAFGRGSAPNTGASYVGPVTTGNIA